MISSLASAVWQYCANKKIELRYHTTIGKTNSRFIQSNFTSFSNIRSFPDSVPRQESISEEKKEEADTVASPVVKERKQSFVPFRNDGSLDYDGK